MRKMFAAAVFLIAFSASAGRIISIDQPSIQYKSGEYFMTVTGTDLGSQFLYDSGFSRYVVDVTADDGVGHVTAWIPQEIINDPGTYTLTVLGGPYGDSNSVTFNITKPGRPSLSLHIPEVLVGLAKTREGAYIRYDFSVTGGDGTGTAKCDPESGTLFPFGKSTIKCYASDQSGEKAVDEIQVSVWDGAKPTITAPASLEVPGDDERGAYVKFDVSAYDDIDGQLDVTCSHKSGEFLPNGKTLINCEAVDLSLNPAYHTIEVMVKPKDTGRLQMALPGDMVVYAENDFEALVEYKVDVYGSADPDPVVQCTPASGEPFGIGDTKVYCVATDDFGASVEGGFTVTVKKGQLALNDVSAEALSPEGAPVEFDTKAEGWSDAITCSHDSGSMFAIGTTKVECKSGSMSGVFDVVVADTIAPHIAAIRTKAGAADSDSNVALQVEVDAVDAADAMPRCSISSLTADTDGASFDWRITADLEAQVRATSAFRVQVSCVDASGNRATDSVPVRLTTPGGKRRVAN